jgi:hypothetical protein
MNEVPDVREHQIFRRWVRRILDDRVRPYLDAWEAKGGLPYAELFPDLGGHGLLGLGRSP